MQHKSITEEAAVRWLEAPLERYNSSVEPEAFALIKNKMHQLKVGGNFDPLQMEELTNLVGIHKQAQLALRIDYTSMFRMITEAKEEGDFSKAARLVQVTGPQVGAYLHALPDRRYGLYMHSNAFKTTVRLQLGEPIMGYSGFSCPVCSQPRLHEAEELATRAQQRQAQQEQDYINAAEGRAESDILDDDADSSGSSDDDEVTSPDWETVPRPARGIMDNRGYHALCSCKHGKRKQGRTGRHDRICDVLASICSQSGAPTAVGRCRNDVRREVHAGGTNKREADIFVGDAVFMNQGGKNHVVDVQVTYALQINNIKKQSKSSASYTANLAAKRKIASNAEAVEALEDTVYVPVIMTHIGNYNDQGLKFIRKVGKAQAARLLGVAEPPPWASNALFMKLSVALHLRNYDMIHARRSEEDRLGQMGLEKHLDFGVGKGVRGEGVWEPEEWAWC